MATPRRGGFVLAVGLVAGLATAGAWPAHADSATTRGKKLFDSDCASCHKMDGSGGMNLGNNVVSADLRSPGLENTYHHDDKLIMRAILYGKDEDGGALESPMPHWNGQLSKQQAKDIISYLKTLCCSKSSEDSSESESE